MHDLSQHARRINTAIGRAIDTYDLIADGDRILVAVSGGKDSLTMLTLLKERLKWIPVRYELIACHVKTDFHCGNCTHTSFLADFFEKLGVRYTFREATVLDAKGETNCFWCSWNKRKALFKAAEELGCGKIAFGHHKDDIVETVLMNMFYKGETSAMNPRQELFKGKIVIIRPLCMAAEEAVRAYAREAGFADKLCRCPYGATSKRKFVKDLIRQIEEDAPDLNIKSNIFNSVARIKEGYVNLKGIEHD